jgi:DNA repair protein RecO (recombination protein O)
MTKQLHKDFAYVIHKRPFCKENHFLFDLLTREKGMVRVFSHISNKAKQSRRYLLQPFCHLSIAYNDKKDLPRLAMVESTAQAMVLSGKKTLCGLYINELIAKLSRKYQPEINLFEDYQRCLLDILEGSQEDLDLPLRKFELSLIKNIGFAINFPDEQQINQHDFFIFELATQSFKACPATFENAIPNYVVQHIEKKMLDSSLSRKTCKMICRNILDQLLEGENIMTRELWPSS